MANTVLKANQFKRVPSSGVCASNIKSGDSVTIESGASLVVASGATFTSTGEVLTSPVINRAVEALTATEVLVAADSGKLLTLGTAGGFDTKLPAPAAGLNFTFVVKVAPTTAYTITTNGTTQNVIHGLVVTTDIDNAGDTDSTAGTAVDVITFAANKALVGDRVELVCDGTLWYAVAYAKAFDGITFD